MLKQMVALLIWSTADGTSQAAATGTPNPVAAARAVVTWNNAAMSRWTYSWHSSTPCTFDVFNDASVWADPRGTVRRLIFKGASTWERPTWTQQVDWDQTGRPRAYTLVVQRQSGQTTIRGRRELLIDPAGKVIQTREWGAVQPEDRIPWPTLKQRLVPAKLIRELTCPGFELP